MNSLNEYKQISQKFRRISSNLLNCKHGEEFVYLNRFKDFIDNNQVITEIIIQGVDDSQYDFKDCFIPNENKSGWHKIVIPQKEKDHIKAIYDLLDYLIHDKVNILSMASSYYIPSRKVDDIIQGFIDSAFRPFISFIIDSLSEKIMILEPESQKSNINVSIGNNSGIVNATKGDNKSINIIERNMVEEISKIIASIKENLFTEDIDVDIKKSFTDDLEIIEEQINSSEPKKNRLEKATNRLKELIQTIKLGAGTIIVVKQLMELLPEIIEPLH